jgi:hypothetical protein
VKSPNINEYYGLDLKELKSKLEELWININKNPTTSYDDFFKFCEEYLYMDESTSIWLKDNKPEWNAFENPQHIDKWWTFNPNTNVVDWD